MLCTDERRMNVNFKKEYICECGKVHNAGVDDYIVKAGAIANIAEYVQKYNSKKPFVFADINTDKAAGEEVCAVLRANAIEYVKYVFSDDSLEPNEKALGSLLMHYDVSCDMIIGVGSGVINDLGKIISSATANPYIIVATAPSMDGYASVTSSVIMDGIKWSIGNKCANVIIGDTNILKNAPKRMIASGLGDMLAKYISIADWQIAEIANGDYYCETVAGMVQEALSACVDNCDGLLKRDSDAIEAVFEGLVLSGVAMNYAEVTRVASGVEHSISHIWDMRGEEFGTNTDLHGIQCGIGTLYAAKIYDGLRGFKPDVQKAIKYAADFDFGLYSEKLRAYMGQPAEAMLEREKADKKYDASKHKKRLDNIISGWNKISQIIESVPPSSEIEKILDMIGAPKYCCDIGISEDEMCMTYAATKDIRDKYVLSRLCWDLGIIDELEF